MALVFCDGFDLDGTSGDVKTETGRRWTLGGDGDSQVTIQTGRYTGKAISLYASMTPTTLARTIAPSGNKLFITFNCKTQGSCVGRIYFGTDSFIEITETGITVTYNSTAGSTHTVTVNTWMTIELVIDTTSSTYQRLYIDGILKEKRLTTPGTETTITLSVDGGYSSAIYDDFIVCDGSGTAGNARLGATARVETLLPSSTVSNTFAGLTGAANAHSVLDNVPQLSTQYIESNADSQAARCDLANATGTVTVIAGVTVSAVVANRDAATQGCNLVTNWAAGTASTHSFTPGETIETVTKSYTMRGDGTAISASDVTALSLQLTQT